MGQKGAAKRKISKEHLPRVRACRCVRWARQIARKRVPRAVREIGTPGTFGIDNGHDSSVVRLVDTHQAFARQPLAGQTTQDSHLKSLDPASARNV
jgi:hypothetical protein